MDDDLCKVAGGSGGWRTGTPEQFKRVFRNPEQRDPRGFVIPSDQPDFPTATKFVNTLIKNGVTIHRNRAFTAAGKLSGGSWVVKSAQAFRPHVLDMFEPRTIPTTFRIRADAHAAADAAGYTRVQMA